VPQDLAIAAAARIRRPSAPGGQTLQ